MKFFVLVLFLLCSAGGYAQVSYGNNPAAGHFLSTRGIRLYYEVYGEGAPVLLLHGNGGSISNMGGQIPFFSQQFKVIAVDTRAHGKSTDPSDSLSFEMIADDFSALLDSLHLDSCNVIGWSDGGIDGLVLAIRHPDKVRRLAITGANLWPDTTGLTPFVFHLMEKEAARLSSQPQKPNTKNALKIINLDLYQPHITLDQLHTIQCPSLVIGGDHDVIPVLHTVLIAQNIPQSYCWIIPNSGHSTPVYKRELFNKTILDFFNKPYRVIAGVATFQ
ncbi:alpha/beta fold hydrolase [Dinghuibacter silviterrae]|uniref:Pimeloyl-ACP methyl ester carboxylesterase n=1 Tax=Dinghuibacter silviterrae TaxID=1539049 RepID=A0A4R8DTW4_9BACT|nr:alpha/beta hydrolase [Dinghuibacter silviterrae]TDX00857.1 pimeloyl-ACP methyl ester carboxylesterase [Dinghuibacter silviterrae]